MQSVAAFAPEGRGSDHHLWEMRSRDEEESLIPVYQIGGVFPFQQGIPATVCLKRLFDKLVDAEASPPPRPPSPDFSEILRIPVAKPARQRFFRGKVSFRGRRTRRRHDWNSRGRILLVLSLHFFDSLGRGIPFSTGNPRHFHGKIIFAAYTIPLDMLSRKNCRRRMA